MPKGPGFADRVRYVRSTEMTPRDPLILISVSFTVSSPEVTSHGWPTVIGHVPGLTGGLFGGEGGGGGIAPCQSKWTRPYRVPGTDGFRSGTTCRPSADTVAVPYGTIRPSSGSRVSNGMLVPGS